MYACQSSRSLNWSTAAVDVTRRWSLSPKVSIKLFVGRQPTWIYTLPPFGIERGGGPPEWASDHLHMNWKEVDRVLTMHCFALCYVHAMNMRDVTRPRCPTGPSPWPCHHPAKRRGDRDERDQRKLQQEGQLVQQKGYQGPSSQVKPREVWKDLTPRPSWLDLGLAP
jgi:hypothetical protein